MSSTPSTTDPFSAPIGITLSGGGYRAAAFHLGALSYLRDLEAAGLLPRIAMISTVSGGTFTGMKYVLSQAVGQSFDEFFCEFYHFLNGTHLLKSALKRLSRGDLGATRKRRDVIVALAEVYSRTFLADKNGQPYRFKTVLDATIPVKEAAFNATEFRTGVAFRFQRSASPATRIGNGYLSIPRDEAGQIRLGDIVAASSCFPGGFEPLAFPDDFDWPGVEVPPAIRTLFDPPVALMDGGVYDNQGVDSLLLANNRSAGALGLFIISDVDQAPLNLYTFPGDLRLGPLGRLTLGTLNTITWLWMVACAMTVLVVGAQWLRSGRIAAWDFFSNGVPIMLAGATAGLIWAGRHVAQRVARSVPTTEGAAWDDFRKLRLSQAATLLSLRLTSLLALTSSVFMRRIRQLVFGLIYGQGQYEDRRVSNLIYSLQRAWKQPAESVQPPSAALLKAIDIANAMPTTLWFNGPDELPSLVACGQATLCHSLMKWVVRRFGAEPVRHADQRVAALWRQLDVDWRQLNEEPFANLRRRLGKICDEQHGGDTLATPPHTLPAKPSAINHKPSTSS